MSATQDGWYVKRLRPFVPVLLFGVGVAAWCVYALQEPPVELPFQRLSLRGHEGAVVSLTFTADGATLASGGARGEVKLWDTHDGRELAAFAHPGPVDAVALAPDGRTLAAVWNDYDWQERRWKPSLIRLWELSSGKPLRDLAGHADAVTALAFTSDGAALLSASLDRTVRIWATDSGERQATLSHEEPVFALALTADGGSLAAGCGVLGREKQLSLAVALDPEGVPGSVKVWDLPARRERATLANPGGVPTAAFSVDGRTLAAGNPYAGTVTVWDVAGRKELAAIPSAREVRAVAYLAHDRLLVTCAADGAIRVWNAATGKKVAQYAGQSLDVTSAAFSNDAALLAIGCSDGTVTLWDIGGLSRLAK